MDNNAIKKHIEKRQAERLLVLRAAYVECGGQFDNFYMSADSLTGSTGLSQDDIEHAVKYLVGEGLADFRGTGYIFSLTHLGCQQVEDSYTAPEEGTPLFPPSVVSVTNNFHAPVAAVQTGDRNTTTVTPAAVNSAASLAQAELLQRLVDLKAELIAKQDEGALSTSDKEVIQAIIALPSAETEGEMLTAGATILKALSKL